MIRIDAHQHFWRLARGDYDWPTPESAAIYRDFGPSDLLPLLGQNGIDATIAVQATPSLAETEYLLSLADDHGWIGGVVGWVDLTSRDAIIDLERLSHHPRLVGIRPMLQSIEPADWILGDGAAPALAALEQLGLVFDALIRPVHLQHIDALAQRYPDLSIVIDHAAKPPIGDMSRFGLWARDIAATAQHPNVFCKLSGLLTEAPANADPALLDHHVGVLIDLFGTDRLIWGSDWPVLLLAADYSGWSKTTDALLAGLDAGAAAAVRGGNAQRIYKLKEGPLERDGEETGRKDGIGDSSGARDRTGDRRAVPR